MSERLQRMRPAMGTWLTVEACAASRHDVLAGIEAAFAVAAALEAQLHPRRPGSDLLRIHEAPLHVPQAVGPDTWTLLALALNMRLLSRGVFDPCLPTLPGTLDDIELAADGTATCHAPLALDLGGIAKGYIIDRAVSALTAHGCTAGLVNAGGDLRVFGDEAQTVMLRRAEGELVPLDSGTRLWRSAIGTRGAAPRSIRATTCGERQPREGLVTLRCWHRMPPRLTR